MTRLYLSAAAGVFSSGTKRDRRPRRRETGGKDSGFRYVREIVGPQDALLEFMTEIDGIQINGIDLIRFNASGQSQTSKSWCDRSRL